ncbi:ATP synthase F1 subunit delta [Calycomorphotria hydatis]|uniref:ATP synthase subunit delta n=1 Tax=Calycomorphotria hydatis TaxID=2528027 RepID=A0A517T6G6_9PLAN|nr:ATP synthase F1 subunit delta [Calycomorphotria hydatis]QDT63969.1 ATP synthase subunit delta [Calycomorphotria hydatis]
MVDAAHQVEAHVRSVMEDPGAIAIARVYAEALLDAAGENTDELVSEYEEFVDNVARVVPEVPALIFGGMLSRDETVGIMERAIIPHCSPVFGNFLRVLAKRQRLDLTRPILHALKKSRELERGLRHVTVRTAVPLTDEQRDNIAGRISASVPFEPIIDTEVDKDLLGGMVIQIGDTIYDSSVRTRLKQLRTRLRERVNNEIQRGRDRFSSED